MVMEVVVFMMAMVVVVVFVLLFLQFLPSRNNERNKERKKERKKEGKKQRKKERTKERKRERKKEKYERANREFFMKAVALIISIFYVPSKTEHVKEKMKWSLKLKTHKRVRRFGCNMIDRGECVRLYFTEKLIFSYSSTCQFSFCYKIVGQSVRRI